MQIFSVLIALPVSFAVLQFFSYLCKILKVNQSPKMKKSLIILIFLAFSVYFLSAQTIHEKKIAGFPNLNTSDAYSFKYDRTSGTYYYAAYDTTLQKYTVYSNKGNSHPYGSVIDYTGIIDKDGNYYLITNNNIDTVYTYYVVKNGEEAASFDYIDPNWTEKNGVIYFMCKEKEKYFLAQYNLSDGTLGKSKPYDEIFLVYYPQTFYEDEPMGTIGFTGDGKPYYVASLNNERFLVIDDREQKHYSDIETYNVTFDKNGSPVYFAKDNGKFYDIRGNTFLVQGDKEYKKFDYLYGPILFDNSNTPIYVGGDSTGDAVYRQRLVIGNTEGKTYSGGVYDVKFTPTGKIAYIASITVNADKGIYESYAVIDGKEGKKYRYINTLNYLPDGTPVYVAGKTNEKAVIVRGTEEIPVNYPNILDLKVLPDGGLAYIMVKYGDYEKKQKDKYMVVIGDEELGPFDGMQPFYSSGGSYILTDKKGNYVFIAQKLIDFENYTYESTLYGKDSKSGKYDYFDNVYLYKGKPIYTASKLVDKTNYGYDYMLYSGIKAIGHLYNSISDFKFVENSGTVSFIGGKGKDFYFAEVKF
jgi:hypothetical protein